MKTLRTNLLAVPIFLGIVLAGCASPNIVLIPNIPSPAAKGDDVDRGSVQLIVDGTEGSQQLSSYEETTDKTQVGRSESLGVHLSDFWVEEAPPFIVKGMLENNLKAWGYQITPDQQRTKLHGQVNQFALNNRAINAFQFQADGVIDINLSVFKDDLQAYKINYVETCTFKTASIPGKENMNKVFNECVAQIQKRLDEDKKLRAALGND